LTYKLHGRREEILLVALFRETMAFIFGHQEPGRHVVQGPNVFDGIFAPHAIVGGTPSGLRMEATAMNSAELCPHTTAEKRNAKIEILAGTRLVYPDCLERIGEVVAFPQ
jgi:hypothetical protein